MKISFLIYSLRGGGAERMVCRLADSLTERGQDVNILVFDNRSPSYETVSGVKIIDLGVQNKKSAFMAVRPVCRIRRYIRRRQPDILFCFTAVMIPYAVLANTGLHKKCRIIGAERTNPHALKKVYQVLEKIFLYGCDGFLFQTEGAKECYPKWIQKKGTVIGNIAPCCSKECGQDTLNKMEYAVCSAGRLHKAKDFATLLRSFQAVVLKERRAQLYIYGEGPMKAELQNMAFRLGIAKHVHFEGFSKNLLKELGRYEIFAFSSRAEGMPNVLLEAMSVGLACVSSDCDYGPSELIEDGINGYLVPVGDYRAMAGRLLNLLENKELRKRIGKRAQEVNLRYSKKQITDEYLLYAEYIKEMKCLKK